MIIAGNLRRTITISRLTKVRDQYGSETDKYNSVMVLKAELLTTKGNLVKNSLELFASKTLTFLIYYREILYTDRVEYEKNVYRIIDIDEIGYREQLKLTVELINL